MRVNEHPARHARAQVAAVALLAAAVVPCYAFQAAPVEAGSSVTVEEVLARMGESDKTRSALLKTYTSLRNYKLENRRFGTKAEVRARMNFVTPGKKEFEILFEQGSGIVRKRVLQRMIKEELEASEEAVRVTTAITAANYSFRLLGKAAAEDRQCYLLEVEPKRKGKFLLRGRIWVDAEDYAIIRIEASPAKNPSFLIRKTAIVHRYGKFGPFWLPVSNQSTSDVMIYGKTEVRVAYSDYVVNGERLAADAGESKSPVSKTPEVSPGSDADKLFKR